MSAISVKIILVFLFLLGCFLKISAQDFHSAISKQDTTLALELLKAGADVNGKDKNGNTALMTAVRWGDVEMTKFLLAHGATPDEPRSDAGRTSLIVTCAYYGGVQIVKMLLDKGADVNAAANNGVTSLMMAANSAKADVVELLLKHGADKNLKDEKGHTALDIAIKAEITEWTLNTNKDAVIDKEKTIQLLKN